MFWVWPYPLIFEIDTIISGKIFAVNVYMSSFVSKISWSGSSTNLYTGNGNDRVTAMEVNKRGYYINTEEWVAVSRE